MQCVKKNRIGVNDNSLKFNYNTFNQNNLKGNIENDCIENTIVFCAF